MPRNARGQFVSASVENHADASTSDVVRQDTWSSALTGLGTSTYDKRLLHSFSGACLSYQEIARLWEKNGIACKAIEAESAEAFREGYELTMGSDGSHEELKEQIEEKLKDIGADDAIELAWQYKRAYGAGIILLGTKDSDRLDQNLDPRKVRSLEYLTVFEPMELTPEDPSGSLSDIGAPQYYRINASTSTLYAGANTSERVRERRPRVDSRIHASRLIVFQGVKTSRYLQSTNPLSQYYGTSVVDRFIDALRDTQLGFQGAGLLTVDVSQPVIKMQNLHQMVGKDEAKFKARMQALELSRSIARAILLDADKEAFERQTTQLGGIPELLDRLTINLAAHIDIPLSILYGYSPSSLGAPGDAELKLWYNKIRAIQRRKLAPIIERFSRMIMRTLRERKLPSKIGVNWFELERLNEKDRAEAHLNQARGDEIYLKYGVVAPDEMRKTRFTGTYSYETQINTKKPAPGYVAMLPKGVAGEGGTAPGGGAAGAPGAHVVTSYARRDPVKRDGLSDLEYARAKLEQARAAGASPEVIAAHEYVVAYEEEAERLEATLSDQDGAGQHVMFAGFEVCIENARGTKREWVDTDGTTGSTTMKYDYGYVVGTRGTDGDSVDVYLGPNPHAAWVYVVHQNSKASGFAKYDEDKAMLGFDSPNHARDAYLRQYDDERFFGGMTVLTVDEFRLKLFGEPGEKVTA